MWVREQTMLPIEDRATFFGPPVKRITKRKKVPGPSSSPEPKQRKQSKYQSDNIPLSEVFKDLKIRWKMNTWNLDE